MSTVWQEIVSEFLHLYPHGSRLLAVAGVDAERSRHVGGVLAAALTNQGQQVEQFHSPDGDEATLRTDVVAPLRSAAAGNDRVLVVSGPTALLGETARRMWHYAVWQLAGDEAPHTAASALVDVTDPENPRRRFADYCAVPAGYGT